MSSFSFCKEYGKDKVIFVTKEDHATPSKIELPAPEQPEGVITKDGNINWSCPCLGGMATGPCGVDFREAFSCFQYSKADPKGSDCYEAFTKMRDCFQMYPTVYNKSGGGDDDDDDGLGDALDAGSAGDSDPLADVGAPEAADEAVATKSTSVVPKT
ncbi:hypothetical protein KR054_005279 [Drosophila jambulina]|nr:hypothetical protein KR054_011180 [Drosophila jambulina]KAH8293854.1 hypothetical protein KR054_005279 [Drosophila jambulina]